MEVNENLKNKENEIINNTAQIDEARNPMLKNVSSEINKKMMSESSN